LDFFSSRPSTTATMSSIIAKSSELRVATLGAPIEAALRE
jgi:hypothetical protein